MKRIAVVTPADESESPSARPRLKLQPPLRLRLELSSPDPHAPIHVEIVREAGMRHTTKKRSARRCGPLLRLSSSRERERIASYWKINGYPAQILIWTDEEWKRLPIRPADARYHPSGVWCALRIL